jgi:phosphoribosylformylglycinamidine (FGAM) synthase-like enzyme
MEKLLLEGCLEIFASGCLEGRPGHGRRGSSRRRPWRWPPGRATASSSTSTRCPAGHVRSRPYEMLLSESQERMIMVAKPGREHEVFKFCEKWGLEVAIIGKVTNTGRFVCKATPGHDPLDPESKPKAPQTVVDLPVDLLTDAAPKYRRPMSEPPAGTPLAAFSPAESAKLDLEAETLALVGSPNIGSRAWIWRQFDHIVRDGTVFGPGRSDAAVVRVFCGDVGEKFLALSVDCNGRHVELAPKSGAAMAVAECARNIVCSGGEPLGLTDCLNFGSPRNQKPCGALPSPWTASPRRALPLASPWSLATSASTTRPTANPSCPRPPWPS